jgi:hypothetical protein
METLHELARLLLNTTDDLQLAVRELGIDSGYDETTRYAEHAEYLREIRADLKRIGVYQDHDSGEWIRKRRSRARA